jgi:hypothetical protein
MVTKRQKLPPKQDHNLAALIRDALKARDLQQKALINDLPVTQQTNKHSRSSTPRAGTYVKEIMSGKKVPDLKYLLNIMLAVRTRSKEPFSDDVVSLWLASWLTSMVERYSKEFKKTVSGKSKRAPQNKRTAKPALRRGMGFWISHEKDINVLLDQVNKVANQWHNRVAIHTSSSKSGRPTLKAKADILKNCIIIVGASVRYPPTSTLDLFRENSHLSDLMYLPYFDFGNHPILLTDRMLIALDERERKKILGQKHLLVIGGPKVNVAARYLNDSFVFPFCFAPTKQSFDNLFDELKERHRLANEKAVELFYEMLQEPKEEINIADERYKKFKPQSFREQVRDEVLWFREKFTRNAPEAYEYVMTILSGERKFFDPLARHFIVPRTDEHLGVVTLGRNFWAEDSANRVCIVIGGLDKYGTVGALRTLVASDFQSHPLGGIIRASVNTSISEYEQFTSTSFSWHSSGYSVESLIQGLPEMRKNLDVSDWPIHETFRGDVARFDRYEKFIRSFQV